MLNILNNWCFSNNMSVSATKSNVMHFRPNSISITTFRFICGQCDFQIIDKYKYFGLVFHEFLDFSMTAKLASQSASRAIGLLIVKCKSAGGMPYDVFTKLCDSMVWPVIAYGAAV